MLWVEFEVGGGNGVVASCKVFRTFSRFMYGYVQVLSRISSLGDLRPGISAGITRQLDRNLQGTISVKFGLQNTCTCSLQYEDNRHHRNLLGALILSVPASFFLISYRHRFQGDHDAVGKISLKIGQILPVLDVSYDRKVTKYTTIGVVWRLTYCRNWKMSRFFIEIEIKRNRIDIPSFTIIFLIFQFLAFPKVTFDLVLIFQYLFSPSRFCFQSNFSISTVSAWSNDTIANAKRPTKLSTEFNSLRYTRIFSEFGRLGRCGPDCFLSFGEICDKALARK